MADQQPESLDRWADWLLHGRHRGLSEARLRRMEAELRRIRDRVLGGARLRRGQLVLDVGAGTGLLSLDAMRRVGPTGQVVAFDLSRDALAVCRGAACESEGSAGNPIPGCVAGDAVRLPFADGAFDAVVARSVLMYVADRPAAIAELRRVVRPGGRISIFEPINNASRRFARNMGLDLSAVQPTYRQVAAHWQRSWQQREAILSLDERDLVSLFVEAGFTSVELRYDFSHTVRPRLSRDEARAFLWTRPDPSRTSYEEAARSVLDEAAEAHLAKLVEVMSSQPVRQTRADAFVTARR